MVTRVRKSLWLALALAGVSSAVLAQRAPESLLPPGFDNPPPAAPQRAPAARQASPSGNAPAAAQTSSPVVQALPSAGDAGAARSAPSIEDTIDPALLQQLIESAKPKYDIPPGSQRSLLQVGLIAEQDGGLPTMSIVRVNGAFVGPVIERIRGPLVSRWGHILLRRALASRLATPVGMNGADWAAVRAEALLRLGEADTARALVQQVDSGAYTPRLEDVALQSFIATADPVGICPIVGLTAAKRKGQEWDVARAICTAFTGDGPPAMSQFDRMLNLGKGEKIDVLLAQKYAGSATANRRAVTIEWKDVNAMTPWRYGLSLAVGIEPPAEVMKDAGPGYALLAARAPMLPLPSRAVASDVAGGRGILSSAAMVDLYSQIFALAEAENAGEGDGTARLAETLRNAYVAQSESDRLSAIKSIWGDDRDPAQAYSRRVLTAYAAARIVPKEDLGDEAAALIGSMLTAGLDRNALKWAPFVEQGSHAWGILAVAAPTRPRPVPTAALDAFLSDDGSKGNLRSKLLLASLMGLGRVGQGEADAFAKELEVDMSRSTRWTRAIDASASSGNQALVAFLAGFGMQGDSWQKMTPVHLFHIVRALQKVGLEAEARMIAAEAVSRV